MVITTAPNEKQHLRSAGKQAHIATNISVRIITAAAGANKWTNTPCVSFGRETATSLSMLAVTGVMMPVTMLR